MRLSALLILSVTLAACAEKPDANSTDTSSATASTTAPSTSTKVLGPGEAYLAVDGGRIWYKITGGGKGTPAILLHGGPGFASYYMKPLETLGSERPVVRYDQLGAGNSDHVTDTTMFNIGHFVRELDSLRSHLGYDKVDLVGHSWGTILAIEYYRGHPEHVASLTLASPALDIPQWQKNARRLVTTLSDSAQRAIRIREAGKKFDAPDYQNALNEFYGKYVWRHPDSANLDSTFKTVNEGIYNYMQGPSEFTITGTLKDYDATSFLKNVTVPTLYLVGEFDEADPATVRRFSAMTPGSKVVLVKGSAHLMQWDAPDAINKAVADFLRAVDTAPAVQ